MTTEHRTLVEIVGTEPPRAELVAACVDLVNQEVKAKKGMGGIAIKGAYGTVKRIKPKFVPEVIDALLDDWLAKMEPYHVEWRGLAAGGSDQGFGGFVADNAQDVAEALLSVTDERAESSKHKTARKLYFKLRPSAKSNVAGAVPKLGTLISSYF